MSGFVYAVECAGRIKLGYSSHPERRFTKLMADAPFPCTLLGFWPGSLADEANAHEVFKSTREHREWFKDSPELRSFIADRVISSPSRRSVVNMCGHVVQRGTISALAKILGITVGAISQWKAVPAEHALKVAEFTGIPTEVLRPDVFGPAPRKGKAA